MDTLAVSPASLLLPPHICLLLLSTSCTVAAGRRAQVWRDRQWKGKGERERERERHDWQGPGGHHKCLCFCFLILICMYKMFFPSIWLFIFSHPPSIYTRRINSFPILFLTSPHLFSPSVPISLDKFNSSFLSFLTLYFLFYTQLEFFFLFPLISRFTFSCHLFCSGLAEVCILLIRCTAVFWRWKLIFVHALQRPCSPSNHIHSSLTHLLFLPRQFSTNPLLSFSLSLSLVFLLFLPKHKHQKTVEHLHI